MSFWLESRLFALLSAPLLLMRRRRFIRHLRALDYPVETFPNVWRIEFRAFADGRGRRIIVDINEDDGSLCFCAREKRIVDPVTSEEVVDAADRAGFTRVRGS